MTKKIKTVRLENEFLRIFTLSSDHLILQDSLSKIISLSKSSSEILLKDFAKMIIPMISCVLQEYLCFLIKPYLSADNDRVFILLKAFDHKLKVEADVIDYKLQFSSEAIEVNEPKPWILKKSPYGPYEKIEGGRSANFMKHIKKDPEMLY